MAIKNPKKQFNFRVQIPEDPSLPAFSIQDFTLPDVEITPDEHGQGNVIVKTAGIVQVATASLGRILPGRSADAPIISRYFWAWATSAQNMMTGGGSSELEYKRELLVHELDNDGVTVINTCVLIGAWPSKINGKAFKRTESGNLVEEIELSIDYASYV